MQNASVAKVTGSVKTKDGAVAQTSECTYMDGGRKWLPGKSRYGVDGVGKKEG